MIRSCFITRLREEEFATVFTASAAFRVQTSDASLFYDRARRLSRSVLVRGLRQVSFRGLLFRVGERRKDSVITEMARNRLYRIIYARQRRLNEEDGAINDRYHAQGFSRHASLRISTISRFFGRLYNDFASRFFLFLRFMWSAHRQGRSFEFDFGAFLLRFGDNSRGNAYLRFYSFKVYVARATAPVSWRQIVFAW